ncbi:MAG TPA: adenylyl-sulfate kinase [Phycisphaerales bacterium]|nr:adenylyl-sulfate kinase [Phycisphaerales bacterium]
MTTETSKERMDIVIAGHVDHGKSTVIGRLLADTNSLPDGKLDQVRETCRQNAKPFEYAFLLDALKDEQSQGITIDSARVFFQTNKRDYIIIDAPGHIEFLKNMVTGASRAQAAMLVIDAEEGVQENSRRHGYMLSMLGIDQLVVLVNKMDLVEYSKETYDSVVSEYKEFLVQIGLTGSFIPVSGMAGDNVATLSDKMPWYNGKTVLDALDGFEREALPTDKPFRMPIQDVYKFTKAGDKRRTVAGTVDTGKVSVGDELVFYPSGKKSTVRSIEGFNLQNKESASAGLATAFTLDEQIYITRGQMAAKTGEKHPLVTSRLKVNLFWMGKEPMVKSKRYLIKIGTAKEEVQLEEIISVIDGSDLSSTEKKDRIERHDVAECILHVRKGIAFDLTEEIAATGRFVIVDNYEIRGGGIIRQGLDDRQEWVRDYVMQRNYKWETSDISHEERTEKYSQKPTLMLVTGQKDVGKKTIAKAVEARLFDEGKIVYFFGIGNILYGVGADIKTQGTTENKQEHLRRLAEVSNIMLDAGIIVVVAAIGLTQSDLEIIRATVDTDSIEVIWVGGDVTDIAYDMVINEGWDLDETVESVKQMLQNKGIIFKP